MKHRKPASFSNPARTTGLEKEKTLDSGQQSNEVDSSPHHSPDMTQAPSLKEIQHFVRTAIRNWFCQFDDQLRAITSLRGVRWWWEAKRSRRSISDYAQLGEHRYRINLLLLLNRDSNELIHHQIRSEEEVNSGAVSEIGKAINGFLDNSFCREGNSGHLSFGGNEIYIEAGPQLVLAAVSSGNPPPVYQEMMRDFLKSIQENIPGDNRRLGEFCSPKMRKLLLDNQSLDQGNHHSKWRARAVLWIFVVGLILAGLQWQKENYLLSRVESKIREEPGIEILGLKKNFFGKDRLSILRDPMATGVSEVFASAGVPDDLIVVGETSFISLEEPFASFREREKNRKEAEIHDHRQAEIAALYRELEKLSSQTAKKEDHLSLIKSEFYRKYPIQNTAELKWIKGNHWELIGTAVDPYFTRIKSTGDKGLVIGGGTVSLEKFSRDVPGELKTLRSEIPRLLISYRNGEPRITYAGLQARAVLIKKLAQLVIVHDTYSIPPPTVELHAIPITGAKQSQNISIASARLRAESEVIRKSLVGTNVKITTYLDNVPGSGREGVYALIK